MIFEDEEVLSGHTYKKVKLVQAWVEIQKEELLAGWKLTVMAFLGQMNKTSVQIPLFGIYKIHTKKPPKMLYDRALLQQMGDKS